MIRAIGSIVVAIFIMVIPILLTLSFVRDWHDFAKFIFIVGTLAELIVLACTLNNNAE